MVASAEQRFSLATDCIRGFAIGPVCLSGEMQRNMIYINTIELWYMYVYEFDEIKVQPTWRIDLILGLVAVIITMPVELRNRDFDFSMMIAQRVFCRPGTSGSWQIDELETRFCSNDACFENQNVSLTAEQRSALGGSKGQRYGWGDHVDSCSDIPPEAHALACQAHVMVESSNWRKWTRLVPL